MLTLDEKIELAYWIIDHNNNVALTGSLYVYLKCKELNIPYPLDREPQDIDILVNYDKVKDDEEFPVCFCLPPFIEEVEMNKLDFDYPIIGRFTYRGTKIEFLYSDNFRSKFTETKEFVLNRNRGYRDIKYWDFGLMFDLIGAKQYFMKIDSNPEYLNKTRNDIDKLFNMINESNYDWESEYIEILKYYIINNKSLKTYKDYGRICIEGWIWDNIVKGDSELIKWFSLVSSIDVDFIKNNKDKFTQFNVNYLHCLNFLDDHNTSIIKDIVKNRKTELL